MTTFKYIKLLFIILLLSGQSACGNRTFRGKVIDADTLKPIEGAVVLAIWDKTRATIAGGDTVFKEAKETLTDKNGDWSITGPEGSEYTVFPGWLQYAFIYVRTTPRFDFYKPGYKRIGSLGGFRAITYVRKKHNIEGIILIRPGDTIEERRVFLKKYGPIWPLISVSNPEEKLRNLDFSFQYPEKVKRVATKLPKQADRYLRYWTYTVNGLKKAQTREERRNATHFRTEIRNMPLIHKLINEERKRLGLKTRERRKKK